MSLQNKYLQSHEQYKTHNIYSKQTISSQTIVESKTQSSFNPAHLLRNTEYLSHL